MSPIRGTVNHRQSVHSYAPVFGVGAKAHDPQAIEGAITATRQGATQPGLLGSG
jgi:hypothetical protein